MSHNRDLALDWDEPRGRALRDAYLLISGSSKGRQRQWQRHDVIRALYDLSEGKPDVVVDLADLMSATGMSQGPVFNAIDSLEQEGALRTFNGNCVMLLPPGVLIHERSGARPYRAVGDIAELVARGRPGLVATVPGAPEPAAPAEGEVRKAAAGCKAAVGCK